MREESDFIREEKIEDTKAQLSQRELVGAALNFVLRDKIKTQVISSSPFVCIAVISTARVNDLVCGNSDRFR